MTVDYDSERLLVLGADKAQFSLDSTFVCEVDSIAVLDVVQVCAVYRCLDWKGYEIAVPSYGSKAALKIHMRLTKNTSQVIIPLMQNTEYNTDPVIATTEIEDVSCIGIFDVIRVTKLDGHGKC